MFGGAVVGAVVAEAGDGVDFVGLEEGVEVFGEGFGRAAVVVHAAGGVGRVVGAVAAVEVDFEDLALCLFQPGGKVAEEGADGALQK